MNFIIENWGLLVAILIVVGATGVYAYKFARQPNKKQLEQVRIWLLQAVVYAEKELGGNGTGKIKLSVVYDLFVARFPVIAKVMSFNLFSLLVDNALIEMRKMLISNQAVNDLIKNNHKIEPVEVKVVESNE